MIKNEDITTGKQKWRFLWLPQEVHILNGIQLSPEGEVNNSGHIYLVYTKTVDSVFRALWLATQSVNILHYSLIHLQFLRASDAKLA